MFSRRSGDLGLWDVQAVAGAPTAPPGSPFTIKVKDPPTGHVALFAVNDILRMKTALLDNWLKVTVVTDPGAGIDCFQYTVTKQSGTAGSFPAGTAIVNYGQSGDGYILLTADDVSSPRIDVVTHAGAPWTTATLRARMGNLKGWGPLVTDTYGWAAGDYAASKYAYYEPTTGMVVRGNITADAGAIGGVTIASSSVYVGTGAYGNANTGFYFDSAGKFSLKDKLTWDGTTLTLTGNGSGLTSINGGNITTGTVTATQIASGTITATQIATDTITATQIAAGAITASEIASGTITATQLSATAIDSMTITGATIRTASSGARVVLSATTYGGIVGYGASDTYDPAAGTGTYQILWKKSDGKLYAGGGSIVLSAESLKISPSNSGGLGLPPATGTYLDFGTATMFGRSYPEPGATVRLKIDDSLYFDLTTQWNGSGFTDTATVCADNTKITGGLNVGPTATGAAAGQLLVNGGNYNNIANIQTGNQHCYYGDKRYNNAYEVGYLYQHASGAVGWYQYVPANLSGLEFYAGTDTAGTAKNKAVLGLNVNGSVIVGGLTPASRALATNATDGFLYVPTCAGAPTGTPTTYTGAVPIVFDTANNRLYAYRNGAWGYTGI